MHDVISAFLDSEPFDGQELSAALATPEGRELLLDLIAMRALVSPSEATTASHTLVTRRAPRWLVSVAAVVLTLVGGYQLGRVVESDVGTASPAAVTAVVAPEPTAVLKFEPGVNWVESPPNGGS